ncbi:hypothetical protein HPB48_016469 [Haemaphysalis longicornis]|uniref:Uncharacterized protein n=1 Tax=Haemaphysalis longicornis TaxID=44386 RepID=A0A9J6GUF6_HAELO|nr:hypothetical protein HPB48_016469 [Haemaphysalis longicornis]
MGECGTQSNHIETRKSEARALTLNSIEADRLWWLERKDVLTNYKKVTQAYIQSRWVMTRPHQGVGQEEAWPKWQLETGPILDPAKTANVSPRTLFDGCASSV